MVVKCFVIAIVALAFVSFDVTAIECDFNYKVESSLSMESTTNTSSKMRKNSSAKLRGLFECDDGFETDNEVGFDNRFGGNDDYEDSSSTECISSKRTIQPKELNTVYNKMLKLVQNHTTIIQSIEIDECVNKHEPCDNGNVVPFGKKIICRQKFVKIQLKAFNDNGDIVDELFYYPSHCICELVKPKMKAT